MNIYWAKESEENIGKEVINKFDSYKKYILQTGMIRKLRKSYKAFFGTFEIKDVGQSLKAIHVNNYASLIRNLHVMVTAQRPAWSAKAINSDLESQAAAELAEGLLDYYMREKGLETKLNEATMLALYLMEGWVVADWDVSAGEVIAIDEEGKDINSGDLDIKIYGLLDMCRDVYRRDMNHDWYITREFINKWDLAATNPDKAEKIEKLASEEKGNFEYEINPLQNRYIDEESDLVAVYKLYHAKTPAIPEGRLTIVVDKDIVLFDGPLPYKKPYCFPIYTSNAHATAFGHSTMFDLLPLQDAMDANFSAILTNQAANAVQNFQMPKGSGLNVTKVMDGMNVLEFDPKLGPIAPLDLLKTAPEVFNFNTVINDYMQKLANVSSVNRGDAPPGMSGTAMALLQQQSLQSSSSLQLSHTIMLENLGTSVIELLQTFAEEPRIATIVGKTKGTLLKEFSGKDLQGVNRVVIDTANPLTKTTSGRVEIANQLLNTPGMIKTPEQYLGVIATGNLEPLYEFDRSRQHLTKSENEALMEGKPVQAILTDDHAIHVLEHSCVLNNLDARTRPEIIQNTLTHIQDHMNIASQMTPQMAAMLKQTSFAAPPMPPQQGQQNGGGVNPQVIANENMGGGPALPKPAQSPVPNLV